jgi:DNA adenine methylase
MLDLLDGMLDLDEEEEVREHDICKSVFNYPGGKSRALQHILPRLPYTDIYIEPFGGSAALLLARKPVKLEVYNDRFGGVVDFYRCLKDKELSERLVDWLELTVHSREMFVDCKNHWPDQDDIVVRAGMWYYLTRFSFSGIGRNFGRAVQANCIISGHVRDKLVDFAAIHDRLKYVTIENQDWPSIFRDFDDHEAVFYVDPPYIDAYKGTYKYELSKSDHVRLVDTIMDTKGFVALSAYPNEVYDSYKWDNYYSWEQYVSMTGQAQTETNCRNDGNTVRNSVREGLYIKEAKS